MSMAPTGGRGAETARELSNRRRRQERERLARIEADVRGGRPRFFNTNDRDRLEAALVVTRLFDKARKAGHRRAWIDDRLAEKQTGSGTENLRLDRWILKRGDTVVDEATVARYRDSKNPQRRIVTYFKLVEFFADLLGEDAEPHKLDMVRHTSLWREGGDDEQERDVQPDHRLADLLRACARSVANRTDFAARFSKARRLHVGWNLESKPEAVPLAPDLDGMVDLQSRASRARACGTAIRQASPSWGALRDLDAALAFGVEIWRDILAHARPRLVIGMGGVTNRALMGMLGVTAARTVPVGWGNVTAVAGAFGQGRFVGLPHLSRFRIVGRPESAVALRQLFGVTQAVSVGDGIHEPEAAPEELPG